MIRAWAVQIRLFDEAANKLAETAIKVSAHDPGLACPAAWAVMKSDMRGRKLPTVGAVQFVVKLDKGANK